MSGFTDAFYVENTKKYRGYLGTQPDDPTNACPEDGGGETGTPGCLLLPCCPQNVDAGTEAPEFWFRAAEVWEVAAADVALSLDHACARGFAHPTRGLSLRSPRFVRKRPDKGIRYAPTAQEIASLFRAQAQCQARATPTTTRRRLELKSKRIASSYRSRGELRAGAKRRATSTEQHARYRIVVGCGVCTANTSHVELELELVPTHMAHKPVLRVRVCAHA